MRVFLIAMFILLCFPWAIPRAFTADPLLEVAIEGLKYNDTVIYSGHGVFEVVESRPAYGAEEIAQMTLHRRASTNERLSSKTDRSDRVASVLSEYARTQLTRKKEVRFWIKGDKIRREYGTLSCSFGDPHRSNGVSVFDGEKAISLYVDQTIATIQSTFRNVNPFRFGRGMSDLLQDARVVLLPSDADDENLHVLKVVPGAPEISNRFPSGTSHAVICVDACRDFICPTVHLYDNRDKLLQEIICKDFAVTDDGIWYPKEAAKIDYRYTSKGHKRVKRKEIWEVKEFLVNIELSDQVFQLDIPSGATVSDQRFGRTFMYNPGPFVSARDLVKKGVEDMDRIVNFHSEEVIEEFAAEIDDSPASSARVVTKAKPSGRAKRPQLSLKPFFLVPALFFLTIGFLLLRKRKKGL